MILFRSTFKPSASFFPLTYFAAQLHKQLHQHTQGRADLWCKDLSPQSNCGDSELFNLNCCQRKTFIALYDMIKRLEVVES